MQFVTYLLTSSQECISIPFGGDPFTLALPTSSQFVDKTVPPDSVNDFIIAFFCSSVPLPNISWNTLFNASSPSALSSAISLTTLSQSTCFLPEDGYECLLTVDISSNCCITVLSAFSNDAHLRLGTFFL